MNKTILVFSVVVLAMVPMWILGMRTVNNEGGPNLPYKSAQKEEEERQLFRDAEIGIEFYHPKQLPVSVFRSGDNHKGRAVHGSVIELGSLAELEVASRAETQQIGKEVCEGPCIGVPAVTKEWDDQYQLFSSMAEGNWTSCNLGSWPGMCQKKKVGDSWFLSVYIQKSRYTENVVRYITFWNGRRYLISYDLEAPGERPLSPEQIKEIEQYSVNWRVLRSILSSMQFLPREPGLDRAL